MNSIEATKKLIDEERLGALVTVLDGPDAGMKAVLDFEEGLIAGELPASLAGDVTADAAELMGSEQNKTLFYGEVPVFIETVAPQPVMMIFGAGHNAQPLSTMAKLLGFRVVVADARPMWATDDRFPDADEVVVGWPEQVFEKLTPDRRTYVVLLSHDVRFEDPVFDVVHGKPIRYLGAIGSRRTHAARRERLASTGWSEDELDTIFGPIGLDIGAETPAEMAVSILGEIVQVRYGMGSGASLRSEEGRINKRRGDA
jgi:xanthine dehydrogenase accessory factor